MSNQIKKNVLIISANGLGKTGVPNVIYQVASVLCGHFNVDVITFNDDDYYAEKIKLLGAKIFKIDLHEPQHKLKRFFWRFLIEKKEYKKAFSTLFEGKDYFAIHSFKEYDSAYIFELAKKYGINNLIIHCNNEISAPKSRISRILFNKKAEIIKKCTTKLIGVSSRCCSVSYPGMEFDVLFNSYDENKYNLNVGCVLKDNELVLTQIATFSSRKNQLFTLDIFQKILESKSTATLNLIGIEVEKGYLEQIKHKINELNIEKNVNIIDGNKNFDDYLKLTSYLLLPSKHEAAPITLVEGQACGIHCFASDTITKDVDCGGISYLNISDGDLWAKSIINEFKNSGNRRMRFNMENFSSSHFKKTLLKIYDIND